jgi:hypothetical protein
MGAHAGPETEPRPLELFPVRGRPYERRPGAQVPVFDDLKRIPFPAGFKLDSTETEDWPEVMEKLARCVPMSLFSDHFTALPHPKDRGIKAPPNLKGLSLAEGLDALCDYYGRLWWRDQDALFFRSRRWFVDRLYEVPPPVLAFLRQELAAHAKLDAEGLTALSRLTFRQLEGLNAASALAELGIRRGMVLFYRDPQGARAAHGYLQVYATLNETQKGKVLTPSGLPIAEMAPEQQQALVQMLVVERGHTILDRLADFRLRAHQGTAVVRRRESVRVYRLGFTYADRTPFLARWRWRTTTGLATAHPSRAPALLRSGESGSRATSGSKDAPSPGRADAAHPGPAGRGSP